MFIMFKKYTDNYNIFNLCCFLFSTRNSNFSNSGFESTAWFFVL